MALSRILVIQTAFIGDVVLATALVEKLSAAYPEAEIDMLVRKGNEGLLQGHPRLHTVLVWNKQQKKYRHLREIWKLVRARRYDLVVNLQRFAATGFVTAFSGAKETVGFDKNPWSFAFTRRVAHTVSTPDAPLHEVQRNQALIAHLAGDQPGKPRLYPRPADEEQVQSLKQEPYVCIAPASVWFTKQFPAEQWVSLVRALPPSLRVYLIGGPADHALCERIREAVWKESQAAGQASPGMENLCGKLGFLASAALQRDARMNYVNDSAPMHFASAVNGPVTAIYCSTLPSFGFGPLSDRSWIVESKEALRCRPCGLHGHRQCPEGHFHCAKTIRTEQLLEPLA